VRVEGFKSLRTRHEIPIRPLTVLAGVNSSGKSSAMQPLLLLKQTLDTAYDPGPLQLSGPNVDITAIGQVLSRPVSKDVSEAWFGIGVTTDDGPTEWRFGRDRDGDLRILEMSGWFTRGQEKPAILREGMTDKEVRRTFPTRERDVLIETSRNFRDGSMTLAVARERCFLLPVLRSRDGHELIGMSFFSASIEQELSKVIHLPALRGNPLRTYRTVAVEDRFPGTFETYTAGVISAWQNRGQTGQLAQLRADLEDLGLTWKVEARKIDDAQVELVVGRLPHARRGGARDLVNIADVGFGVSQTLPVIVALLAAGQGQVVYLEQPEIHLHPRAQVTFANLLRRAVERGVRVVVETHSALLVRAIQTLVAQGKPAPEDVILHWFTRHPDTGYTEITTGEVDRAGAYGDWPEDFDDVYLESQARYLDAAAEAPG
jgi:hypothetical protein